MNANYIYKVYRLQGYIRELMGHTYDYNCAVAMLQMVDPIPAEEQHALLDFMNENMEVLVPAYQQGYEQLEQAIAAIMAKQNPAT